MTDREEVIKGLECCTKQSVECKSECPYYDSKKRLGTDCFDVLKADALALLKAQEPKQVKRDRQCEIAPNEWIRKGICPCCQQEIRYVYNRAFCGFCGQAVKWE